MERFEYYAGGADKLHGDTIPYLPGYGVQVLRVPVGVSGHIGHAATPGAAAGFGHIGVSLPGWQREKVADTAASSAIFRGQLVPYDLGDDGGSIGVELGATHRASLSVFSHPRGGL